MNRRKNKFRIIRTGENEYEVWQQTCWMWVFHRWVRIGTHLDYGRAQGLAYAEAARTGAPCIIDYIDNLP